MATGDNPQLSVVDMHRVGTPVGGSDGAYLRALYVGSNGAARVTLTDSTSQPIAVASDASAVTAQSGSGTLVSVLVTSPGTAAVTIYDNATEASGAIIGYIPANAPAGQNYAFNMPFNNGVTLSGNAANPNVTLNVSDSQSPATPGSNPVTFPLPVAANASAVVALATKGTLNGILVTATGTAAVTIYDNASAASGTIIGYIPANTPAGAIIPLGIAAVNGITLSGNADNPNVTLSITASVTPTNAAISVSSSLTVIKAAPGTLFSVIVTTPGSAAATFYDNASAASGTIIGYLPANAPAGNYPFDMPAVNGIVMSGNASNPAVTANYQ